MCVRCAGCGGEQGQHPIEVWVSEPGGSMCVRACVRLCVPATLSDLSWSALPGKIFSRGTDSPSSSQLPGNIFSSTKHEQKTPENPWFSLSTHRKTKQQPALGRGPPPSPTAPRNPRPWCGGALRSTASQLCTECPHPSTPPAPQCRFPHSRNFLATLNSATAVLAFKGPRASTSVWRDVSQPRLQS